MELNVIVGGVVAASAPKLTREKKTQTKWVELKKNNMEISLVPVYIYCEWRKSQCNFIDLIFAVRYHFVYLFCSLDSFFFYFSAPSQRYFAYFHSILILIWFLFEHFPKQFSLVFDQFCIMRAYKIQLLLNILFFIFENNKIKRIFEN